MINIIFSFITAMKYEMVAVKYEWNIKRSCNVRIVWNRLPNRRYFSSLIIHTIMCPITKDDLQSWPYRTRTVLDKITDDIKWLSAADFLILFPPEIFPRRPLNLFSDVDDRSFEVNRRRKRTTIITVDIAGSLYQKIIGWHHYDFGKYSALCVRILKLQDVSKSAFVRCRLGHGKWRTMSYYHIRH